MTNFEFEITVLVRSVPTVFTFSERLHFNVLMDFYFNVAGVTAIKDVLIKSLLPDHRRLRHFHQHPLDQISAVITVRSSFFNGVF